MKSPIKLITSGKTPTTSNLATGELAYDTNKLFGNFEGTIVQFIDAKNIASDVQNGSFKLSKAELDNAKHLRIHAYGVVQNSDTASPATVQLSSSANGGSVVYIYDDERRQSAGATTVNMYDSFSQVSVTNSTPATLLTLPAKGNDFAVRVDINLDRNSTEVQAFHLSGTISTHEMTDPSVTTETIYHNDTKVYGTISVDSTTPQIGLGFAGTSTDSSVFWSANVVEG